MMTLGKDDSKDQLIIVGVSLVSADFFFSFEEYGKQYLTLFLPEDMRFASLPTNTC